MQFDSNKIYVCTHLAASEPVQILIKEKFSSPFFWSDLHCSCTFPFGDLNDNSIVKGTIYILDNMNDLADFIQGKRDFPIFKTDEEEQKEKDEEAKKSQECDNGKDKLEKLKDIIGDLFDSDLDKNYDSYTGTSKICNNDCDKNDYDCRNCFVNYIQRIVA